MKSVFWAVYAMQTKSEVWQICLIVPLAEQPSRISSCSRPYKCTKRSSWWHWGLCVCGSFFRNTVLKGVVHRFHSPRSPATTCNVNATRNGVPLIPPLVIRLFTMVVTQSAPTGKKTGKLERKTAATGWLRVQTGEYVADKSSIKFSVDFHDGSLISAAVFTEKLNMCPHSCLLVQISVAEQWIPNRMCLLPSWISSGAFVGADLLTLVTKTHSGTSGIRYICPQR